MMIFSLVAMTGLEKCCITSAYLQWLCHSGERPVGLLFYYFLKKIRLDISCELSADNSHEMSSLNVSEKSIFSAAVVTSTLRVNDYFFHFI